MDEDNRADDDLVTVGNNASISGAMRIDGSLRVQGRVNGAVHATGDVDVESTGSVAAPIDARNVVVTGSVKGNTSATLLHLAASASFAGDARAARVVVADGATVTGTIAVGDAATAVATTPREAAVAVIETVVEPVVESQPVVGLDPVEVAPAPTPWAWHIAEPAPDTMEDPFEFTELTGTFVGRHSAPVAAGVEAGEPSAV